MRQMPSKTMDANVTSDYFKTHIPCRTRPAGRNDAHSSALTRTQFALFSVSQSTHTLFAALILFASRGQAVTNGSGM